MQHSGGEEHGDSPSPAGSLASQRIALVGRLAGMSRREAQRLVRQSGATLAESPDAATTLVVLGEQDAPADPVSAAVSLEPAARAAFEAGTLAIIGESQLWQQLGLVDREHDAQQLYTPPMLARLVNVEVATIRRWHGRGWLVATREVRRLPYFAFEEIATARRIQELLAAGMTPAAVGKALAALARQLPEIKRPLAELSIVVEGKQLLVRGEGGLIEAGGQLHFDFDAVDDAEDASCDIRPLDTVLQFDPRRESPLTPDDLLFSAGQLEDQGDLHAAADAYRASLVAGGPRAETNFLLAETLYRLGELPAARERYYMAIELDEDYVEARLNLGCVLAELGELELAASAFEGALAFHDDYEDAHYHLARTLDRLGRSDDASRHWERFLELAPASPWADEARERLEQ
jgi:tetratricopeptide (TPR) repeat protein